MQKSYAKILHDSKNAFDFSQKGCVSNVFVLLLFHIIINYGPSKCNKTGYDIGDKRVSCK